MPLIGTAGHVDHGKSTLVQRITGRDPDRWAEEKRRGLTIDLGFAWTTLPDGTEVSFVDVPGHARFLKNMLAGIEAVDVALLVVAADEGWKPQSEEHLAVLELLGVSLGVVALAKSDLVENDLLELAASEVTERLGGSKLSHAAVVPVSAATGAGISELITALTGELFRWEARDVGRPRLWVDRAFTVAGAGVVVTGTLVDGHLSVEDPIQVYPLGVTARIRGIQSHERSHERIGPGRRVALNLTGVSRDQVKRGDMVGLPGHWDVTDRFTASVRLARYTSELPSRGAYHLHIGSTALPVQISASSGDITVLRTPRPLPVAAWDRFILRDTGRRLVVAGGEVLDPQPPRTSRALEWSKTLGREGSPNGLATALLTLRGSDTVRRLAAHSLGGVATEGVKIGDLIYSEQRLAQLGAVAIDLVTDEHSRHPLREGLPLATLAERLGVAREVAEHLVDRTPELTRMGPAVTRLGWRVQVDKTSEQEWERIRAALGSGLAVPTIAELDADPELIHLKVRTGELVRVSADLVMLPGQLEQVRQVLADMPAGFTVADFRDAIGLSRKYAVPLLEWADSEGLTVRRGDARTLR